MDKEKTEIIIKSITRTDSYLNYANTKSTILLTLSSAILATAGVNVPKMLPVGVECSGSLSFVVFFVFLVTGISLNIIAVMKSLKAISPYLKESAKENVFSFVDMVHYNDNEIEYSKKISEIDNEQLSQQLSSLSYNLSVGLIGKYKSQKTAIRYLHLSILSFIISIFIPWTIFFFEKRVEQIHILVFLSLVLVFLMLMIIVLFSIIVFLLSLKRKEK